MYTHTVSLTIGRIQTLCSCCQLVGVTSATVTVTTVGACKQEHNAYERFRLITTAVAREDLSGAMVSMTVLTNLMKLIATELELRQLHRVSVCEYQY